MLLQPGQDPGGPHARCLTQKPHELKFRAPTRIRVKSYRNQLMSNTNVVPGKSQSIYVINVGTGLKGSQVLTD